MVFVESTFTINAIERANFAIVRHKVDTERYAETAAFHGPKDGRFVNDGTHCIIFLFGQQSYIFSFRNGNGHVGFFITYVNKA